MVSYTQYYEEDVILKMYKKVTFVFSKIKIQKPKMKPLQLIPYKRDEKIQWFDDYFRYCKVVHIVEKNNDENTVEEGKENSFRGSSYDKYTLCLYDVRNSPAYYVYNLHDLCALAIGGMTGVVVRYYLSLFSSAVIPSPFLYYLGYQSFLANCLGCIIKGFLHENAIFFKRIGLTRTLDATSTGAMGLLTRQLGITNFKPMKEAFTAALDGATMYSPSAPLQLFDVQSSCLVRGASPDEDDGLQADEPSPTLTVSALERSSEKGTEFFRGGKFQLASYVYKNILYTAPLIVANTEEEENRLKDVIATARELIGALQCMKFRKAFDAQNDSKQDVTVARSLELACYLTHFNLDPVLLNKVIILATKLAFKSKNFITANNLAQRGRVLVNESSKEFKNYQKVIKNSQKEGQDRLKIEYDPRKPFQICNNTFVALPHGTALVCPYCQATYAPSEKGKLCSVCDMAEIGKRTIGLVCRFTT
eukprot:g2680.t1